MDWLFRPLAEAAVYEWEQFFSDWFFVFALASWLSSSVGVGLVSVRMYYLERGRFNQIKNERKEP